MDGRVLTSLKNLPQSTTGVNLLFKEELIPSDSKIDNVTIRFSTFQKIGLKRAEFKNGSITQSIFEDVYARRAKFANINFTGTTFRNCNFSESSFVSCDFRYCKFQNCQIPHNEIIACLPSEPNLRKELARNLKVNFTNISEKRIADRFLDLEIEAEELELWYIFKADSSFYREHYTITQRISALGSFFKLKFFGFVWGHGHKVWRLFASYIGIMLLFSLIIYLTEAKFKIINGTPTPLTFSKSLVVIFGESIKYTYETMYPTDRIGKCILFIIRILGTVYLGLLGATLYRRVAR